MMGVGIAEVLMMLLMGSVLPSDVEPLTADQLLAGMPAECELLLIQDVRGSYDALNALLETLSTQSWVMSNSELMEGLGEVQGALRTMPTEMVSTFGFNPFTDVTSMGLCGRLASGPSGAPVPSFVMIVQGSFDTTVAGRLAGTMDLSEMTLASGARVYGEREEGVIFGLASPQPGLLLFGTEDLLTGRMAPTGLPAEWQSAAADSLIGRVAALAPGGPRTVAGFAPSAGTRFLVGGEAPVSLAQLLAGLDQLVLLSNGPITYIEATAASADGQRDLELILGGLGAYMEAAPHASRALAYVLLGVPSPDDPDIEEPLRALLRNREELLVFLEGMGLFTPATVTLGGDASTMTTTLMAESPHGLVSFGVLMGIGGAVTFLGASRSYEEPYYYEEAAPMMPTEVPPPIY